MDRTPENHEPQASQEILDIKAKIDEVRTQLPEFAKVVDSLSDQEMADLQETLAGTGMGKNATLNGFVDMCQRLKFSLDIDWGVFGDNVELWKKANEEYRQSLGAQDMFQKAADRTKAGMMIATIMENA